MKLYLSGCGGLHHMMFGACSYIEEHYDLDKIKEIRSISGGNYVAAALLSNYSTRSIWELWSKRLSALIKDYPLTFLFKFYGMISKHSDDILQKLSAKEQLKQYILLTYLFKGEKKWMNNFTSNDDYRECVIAGSYIPCFNGVTKIYYKYQKQCCIDGALCKYPIINGPTTNDKDTDILKINKNDFSSIVPTTTLLFWLIYGLFSTYEHHKKQFDIGYLYAKLFLKNKLDKLLLPRTDKSQKYLNITGKIKWSQNTFI